MWKSSELLSIDMLIMGQNQPSIINKHYIVNLFLIKVACRIEMTLFLKKKKTPLQQCNFASVCLKLWVLIRKKY
jgi:hypothetical protein